MNGLAVNWGGVGAGGWSGLLNPLGEGVLRGPECLPVQIKGLAVKAVAAVAGGEVDGGSRGGVGAGWGVAGGCLKSLDGRFTERGGLVGGLALESALGGGVKAGGGVDAVDGAGGWGDAAGVEEAGGGGFAGFFSAEFTLLGVGG